MLTNQTNLPTASRPTLAGHLFTVFFDLGMHRVNFSIELSWLLREVYAYWCVYLMDTFIKILPEKAVIFFYMFFFSMYFSLLFRKENCQFWSIYTNNYLIDNKQNNWWYSVHSQIVPRDWTTNQLHPELNFVVKLTLYFCKLLFTYSKVLNNRGVQITV